MPDADVDHEEVVARTRFGAAQTSLVLGLVGLAVACGFGAWWSLRPPPLEAGGRAVPWEERLDGLESMSFRHFAACRAAQLLDDPEGPPPHPALPVGTHPVWELVAAADFRDVTCRPADWLGPGSRLDALPPGLATARRVDNPLWSAETVGPSLDGLAEAELRLWDQLEREWSTLTVTPARGFSPPPRSTLGARPAPPLFQEVLAGLLAALLLIGAVAVGSLDDRLTVRAGLRGLSVGGRTFARRDVRGIRVAGGRLEVLLADGSVWRSPVLADPSAVRDLVDAWARLPPVPDDDPAATAAVRGRLAALTADR